MAPNIIFKSLVKMVHLLTIQPDAFQYMAHSYRKLKIKLPEFRMNSSKIFPNKRLVRIILYLTRLKRRGAGRHVDRQKDGRTETDNYSKMSELRVFIMFSYSICVCTNEGKRSIQ